MTTAREVALAHAAPKGTKDFHVVVDKCWRRRLKDIADEMESELAEETGRGSRERSLAMTKVEEAIMWVGMDMRALAGGKSCYANGYKTNAIVDPQQE